MPADYENAIYKLTSSVRTGERPVKEVTHPNREREEFAPGESPDMRIREMALIVGTVLIVSSQAPAGVVMSISKTAHSFIDEQNAAVSIPVTSTKIDLFNDLMESGMAPFFIDLSGFNDTIPPRGQDSYLPADSITEPYKTFGTNSAAGMPLITSSGAFLIDDAQLNDKRPPSFIDDATDLTSPLYQQTFATDADLKNLVNSSRVILFSSSGINDGSQWNLSELNFAVHSIPAPAVILIGSFALGFVGWTRISRTYTV